MTTWTSGELDRIGDADELQIAPQRPDGTLRRPLPIWVVRLGDDLYVRSVNGRGAAWFLAALASGEGHIEADGIGKDVTFVETGPGPDDEIDAVYRAKYGRYPANYVEAIVDPKARAATLRLLPRD